MYERLLHLYSSGSLSEAGLDTAVSRGWITEEQAQTIRDST